MHSATESLATATPAAPGRTALVLLGGGARTAYQAGVLGVVARLLERRSAAGSGRFPFQILAGTSAGALNAACLACHARLGLPAFDRLADLWHALRAPHVFRLQGSGWARRSRWLMAAQLTLQARSRGAALDSLPLADSLHRAIDLPAIDVALESGSLDVLAVTASSYSSGAHWTFCQTRRDLQVSGGDRHGRRMAFQPITIEHLMASSAIPFLFPATPLWVDGQREYFGDGSMRQTSPLSAAIHLGADRILAIGVGQPQRSALGGAESGHTPTLSAVAGHALASVFHDTLAADVDQARRITRMLRELPEATARQVPYRPVEVLCIQPGASLDALAQAHVDELPADLHLALAGLGGLRGPGAALASYLLFEPGFIRALMALGAEDARARESDIARFLGLDSDAAVR